MAIYMHAELPGVTTEQYEELNAALAALPGNAFEGVLAHVCVAGDTGLDVYDLWESREAMDAFMARMAPVARGLGWNAPPAPGTVAEVHRYWIPGDG
ncbi:hypothetical protein AB0G74_29335 [Streptomyces sp. NPDC020875]|uniref:hypothetical protein n=1 Tax=Streptomyces sp. NPDC020875 TaxID=3154898 RepID=UPI00340BB8CA